MNPAVSTNFNTIFSNNMSSDDNSWTSGLTMEPSWGNFFGSLIMMILFVVASTIVFLIFKEVKDDGYDTLGIFITIMIFIALLLSLSGTAYLVYLTITTFPL